ncbi:hypothetical protein CJU89_3779 [Yarrowia sp. B02]|nr:hypothetical protein CJU89_3779 [Yarrowia sp. B02]
MADDREEDREIAVESEEEDWEKDVWEEEPDDSQSDYEPKESEMEASEKKAKKAEKKAKKAEKKADSRKMSELKKAELRKISGSRKPSSKEKSTNTSKRMSTNTPKKPTNTSTKSEDSGSEAEKPNLPPAGLHVRQARFSRDDYGCNSDQSSDSDWEGHHGWPEAPSSTDEEPDELRDEFPQWTQKYRAALTEYLSTTPIFRTSALGAYRWLCEVTGYEFDDDEEDVLMEMLRRMLELKYTDFGKGGDAAVLWYAGGIKKRNSMWERLRELRSRRADKEEKKKKKRPRKTLRDGLNRDYVKSLVEGYTAEFEGVDFYYPPIEDLTDAETLMDTPLPSGESLTEEQNLADMIRDSYRVSVADLRHVIPGEDDRDRFAAWIAYARDQFSGLDLLELGEQQAKQLGGDYAPSEITSRTRGLVAMYNKTRREYRAQQVLWSVPTAERTRDMLWFERDYGLGKAARMNYVKSNFPRPETLKPVSVYLVDTALEPPPAWDLQRVFRRARVTRERYTDPSYSDNVGSDPFAAKTYYMSDTLHAELGHRLLRHRDVVLDIFKLLKMRHNDSPTKPVFLGDTFLVCSKKLRAIFPHKQMDEYMTWKEASDYLFRNHYFEIPGRPLRPTDPIFYVDQGHRNYLDHNNMHNKVREVVALPHHKITFTAASSTSEHWRRHESRFHGFRDTVLWEQGLRKWLGSFHLYYTTGPTYRDPAETAKLERQFDSLLEKERLGKTPEWFIASRAGAIREQSEYRNTVWRDKPHWTPSWYSLWRSPWVQNLGLSSADLQEELAILRNISRSQQDEYVDNEDGWLRRRVSPFLEHDFLPSKHLNPFPFHFVDQEPEPLLPRKHKTDVDPHNPWDQTVWGFVASKNTDIANEGSQRPPKRRKLTRKLWGHPQLHQQIRELRFEDLYGFFGMKAANKFRHQAEPRQVYLGDDEIDMRKPRVEEVVEPEVQSEDVQPIVEEVSEEPEDVEMSGEEEEQREGPTITEMDIDPDLVNMG